MAKDYRFITTVVVDNDVKSTAPTQHNGYMVANGAGLNLPTGSVAQYDYLTGQYSPIDYTTASLDAIQKVSQYSTQYQQSKAAIDNRVGIFTDRTNHKELNSLADVMWQQDGFFGINRVENLIDTAKSIVNDSPADIFKTVWNNSDLKALINTGKDAFELIQNTVINPLRSDNNALTKAHALFQNTLTNLSETLDMVDGANSVKGIALGLQEDGVKGAWKNLRASFGLGSEGRKQFDYNTGNVLGDIALEIVSSPSSWFTFGASAVAKQTAKNVVSDMLVKTAADTGTTILKSDADKLAKQVAKYWNNSKETLGEATARVQFSRFNKDVSYASEYLAKGDVIDAGSLKKIFTPQHAEDAVHSAMQREVDYLTALKNNVDILKTSKAYANLEAYKGVGRTMDAVQGAATKAALSTSGTLFGYLPVVGVLKALENATVLETVQAIFNRANREFVEADFDITDIVEKTEFAEEYFSKAIGAVQLKNTWDAIDNTEIANVIAKDAIAIASRADLEAVVSKVNSILLKGGDSFKATKEANALIQKESKGRYNTVAEFIERLEQVEGRTHFSIRPLISDLRNRVEDVQIREGRQVTKAVQSLVGDVAKTIQLRGTTAIERVEYIEKSERSLERVLRNNYMAPNLVESIDIFKDTLTELKTALIKGAEATAIQQSKQSLIEEVVHLQEQSTDLIELGEAAVETTYQDAVEYIALVRDTIRPQDTEVADLLDRVLNATWDAFTHPDPDIARDIFYDSMDEIDTLVAEYAEKYGARVRQDIADVIDQAQDKLETIYQNFYTLEDMVQSTVKAPPIKVYDAIGSAIVSPLRPKTVDMITALDDLGGKGKNRPYVTVTDRTRGRAHIPKDSRQDLSDIVDMNGIKGRLDALATELEDYSKYSTGRFERNGTPIVISGQQLSTSFALLAEEWGTGYVDYNTITSTEEALDSMTNELIADMPAKYSSSLQVVRKLVAEAREAFQDVPAVSIPLDILRSGSLYHPIIAKRNSMSLLLGEESVQSILHDIYNTRGIGQIVTLGLNNHLGADFNPIAQRLAQIAHDNNITNYIMEAMTNIGTPEERRGLLDVLASKQMYKGDYMIHDPEAYVIDHLIPEMRTFLDSITGNLDPMKKQAGRTLSSRARAYRVRSMYLEEDAMFSGLIPDKDLNYDIVYNMSPIQGTMYEITLMHPVSGKLVTILNKFAIENLRDDVALAKTYGVYAKEKESEYSKMMSRLTTKNPDYIVASDEDEVALAVANLIRDLKEEARHLKKGLRFIGFNNADETNATDKILNTLLRTGNTAQQIGNTRGLTSIGRVTTIDIAQQYRVNNGSWIASNELVQQLTKLFDNVRLRIEATQQAAVGKGLTSYVPKLIVDVNTDLIENLTVVYNDLLAISEGKEPAYKEFGLINTLFVADELPALGGTLTSAIRNIAEVLTLIKNSNIELSETVIIGDAVKKLTGNPNIMPFIDTTGHGIKTIYNHELVTKWVPGLKSRIEAITPQGTAPSILAGDLASIYSRVLSIDNIAKRVKNLGIISEYLEAYESIGMLISSHLAVPVNTKNAMIPKMLDTISVPDDSPQNVFAYAKWNFERLKSKRGEEFAKTFVLVDSLYMLENDSDRQLVLKTLLESTELIYKHPTRHIQGIPTIRSKNLNIETGALQEVATILEARQVLEEAKTMRDLRLRKHSLQGVLNRKVRDAEPMLPAYNAYINFYEDLVHRYDTAIAETPHVTENRFQGIKPLEAEKTRYSDRIEALFITPKDLLKAAHSKNRYQTTFNLSASEYTQYLYKYAGGAQVIDLKAKALEDIDGYEELLIKFFAALEDAKKYGVNYLVDSDTTTLYTWLDTRELDSAGLNKLAEVSKKYTVKPHDVVGTAAFFTLGLELDKLTGNAFTTSSHSAFTIYQYREVVAAMPEAIRPYMLSEDYLDEIGAFTGKLNASVLGDYEYGAYNMMTNMSPDPYTNIASGFNSIIKSTIVSETYLEMVMHDENKLRQYVDRGFTKEELLREDLVPIILKDGQLVRTSMKTNRDFKRALDNDAILLDYASYKKAFEIINDNKIHHKLYSALNKYWLVPDKIAKLSSAGQIFRNIPESLMKVWVQAGGDPAVFTGVPESVRELLKYDRTLALVSRESVGFINTKALDDFYKKHGDRKDLVSREDFEEYRKYFNSSDSAPTAQQERESKDVIGILRRAASGSEAITEDILTDLIKMVTDLKHNNDAVNAEITAKYTGVLSREDIILLKRIKAFIPEWYTTPTSTYDKLMEKFFNNPFLKMGSTVETHLRFHAFRYFRMGGIRTHSETLREISIGQNNRSTDTKGQRLMEAAFPFSSFALHNLVFWATAPSKYGRAIGLIENIYSGASDEEKYTPEELSRNYSLQYALSVKNIVLDDSTGLTLKMNNSLYSALDFLMGPIDTLAGMMQVNPMDILRLIGVVEQNIPFYSEGSEEYAEAVEESKKDFVVQAIPLFNVLYTRYTSAWKNYQLTDSLLPLLFPSIFGVAKTDEAGLTYESRPVGYDWYDQTQEYRDTHRYVFGVSYVPAWMKKDPAVYVNTLDRMVAMGMSKEESLRAMEMGWYISRDDFSLKNWRDQQEEYEKRKAGWSKTPYTKSRYASRNRPRKTYAKKTYANARTFKKYFYARKSTPNMKQYAVNPRRKNASMYPAAYRNMKNFGRRNLYKDNYAKYGASRMMMRMFAGAAPSASKLLRLELKARAQKQYRRF